MTQRRSPGGGFRSSWGQRSPWGGPQLLRGAGVGQRGTALGERRVRGGAPVDTAALPVATLPHDSLRGALSDMLFPWFPGPSRTSGYNLLPSPPKVPMPPDSSSSFWGSKDLQFRGRRLRALGRSGPGQGQGLAAVDALRSALEVASGPSSPAQGCPGPRPAPDPAAKPPALWCLPHLKPITPAQSHP